MPFWPGSMPWSRDLWDPSGFNLRSSRAQRRNPKRFHRSPRTPSSSWPRTTNPGRWRFWRHENHQLTLLLYLSIMTRREVKRDVLFASLIAPNLHLKQHVWLLIYPWYIHISLVLSWEAQNPRWKLFQNVFTSIHIMYSNIGRNKILVGGGGGGGGGLCSTYVHVCPRTLSPRAACAGPARYRAQWRQRANGEELHGTTPRSREHQSLSQADHETSHALCVLRDVQGIPDPPWGSGSTGSGSVVEWCWNLVRWTWPWHLTKPCRWDDEWPFVQLGKPWHSWCQKQVCFTQPSKITMGFGFFIWCVWKLLLKLNMVNVEKLKHTKVNRKHDQSKASFRHDVTLAILAF